MAEIDQLLRGTIEMKGSDLHLSSEQTARVRVRGDLKTVSRGVMSGTMLHSLLDEILSTQQKEEFRTRNELDFTYPVPELGARFRANLFVGRHGPAAVFRVIPSKIPSAGELGLPPSLLKFCEMDRGLVLVTGATGSGKSTTLAAMIDWINENSDGHVLTLEDPIEFAHASKRCLVNQREIGKHSHSFANALKASLREDPDVILVGEMRDLETIELALTAAETGHLVFGTLHTSSAAKTIDRIINVFPANQQEQIRTLLAESLKGVVAQQLIKSNDGGRAAAMEIMVGTHAISNLIREGKNYQIPTQIQMGRSEGMQTMDQALEELRKAGRISDEDAWSRMVSPPKRAPAAAAGAAGGAAPGLAVVR